MSTNLNMSEASANAASIPEAPLAVPGPKRPRMPSQVPILLLVLTISAGALYGMRQYGMKSGFKFNEVKLDVTEQDSEKARTYERIMADLARVQNPLDVTLTDFGSSPFMREKAKTLVTPDVDLTVEKLTDEERHRAEAVDRLKRMKLRGIIGNVARIDDLTVRVGDVIDELFVVTAIDGRTVSFEAYGETFTLTLEQPKPGARKQSLPRTGSPTGH